MRRPGGPREDLKPCAAWPRSTEGALWQAHRLVGRGISPRFSQVEEPWARSRCTGRIESRFSSPQTREFLGAEVLAQRGPPQIQKKASAGT